VRISGWLSPPLKPDGAQVVHARCMSELKILRGRSNLNAQKENAAATAAGRENYAASADDWMWFARELSGAQIRLWPNNFVSSQATTGGLNK
jgi:hypothetical protein